uniref:Conotoxin n=1 Tax=Conus betulinus TaxID=89764 RepID=A0A142C1C7_CONBE|nr:conotoxin [Conus betulinus]
MRCLPVFIILLLLVASAPSADVQPKTKNSMTLASLRDFAKKGRKNLWRRSECCIRNFLCC